MKPLTELDLSILQSAADGLRYQDIADQRKVSQGYVKATAARMLVKMGADNIAQAVAMGFRRGILR